MSGPLPESAEGERWDSRQTPPFFRRVIRIVRRRWSRMESETRQRIGSILATRIGYPFFKKGAAQRMAEVDGA